MNNAAFGKTMKSIGTCHNRKKKGIIYYQNQITTLQNPTQNIY